MRNIPYWLNIGSILYQYGCATRGRDGEKKKIGKANERKGKVKKSK